MLTAAQLRAARGLLDWTRADLAKAANISPETIKNIEHGTFRPQEATTEAIIRSFRAQGVVFTEQEGVRRQHEMVETFIGRDGFSFFMDDVYQTMQDSHDDICVSGVDDRLFVEWLGAEKTAEHVKRMKDIKGIKARVLLREGDVYVPGNSYIQYRWEVAVFNESVPFYVYGNKLAIIIFHAQPAPQVVVIRSELAANAYRRQFDVLWEQGKDPTK